MRNLLGQGAYGKVVSKNGKAVKSFAKLSHIIQEYAALKYLDDTKYIVKATKVDFSKKLLYMKLYDTNLNNWLNEKNDYNNITRKEILKVTHDILRGLIELHDRGLTHGDLKPGNILIREEPLKAVIGDCGFVSLSKYAKVERTARVYRDLIVKHSSKHDIYSFGMCYLTILTGIKYNRPPKDYNELHILVKNKVKDKRDKKIILSCLDPHHNKRPSAREIFSYLFEDSPEKWEPKNNYIEAYSETLETSDSLETSKNSKNSKPHKNPKSLWYKDTLKSMCKKYELNRDKKACHALNHYFSMNNISEDHHDIYVAASLLILSSIFGRSSKFAKNNASNLCNYKYEEEKIYQTLEKLIDNEDYLNILMSK